MKTTPLALCLLVAGAVCAQDQPAGKTDVDSRVDTLLARLGERGSLRFTCEMTNVMYVNRMRAALRRGGRAVKLRTKQFRISGVTAGDVAHWRADEKDPEDPEKAEVHVLARKGARWVMKGATGPWIVCQRPSGVWQSAYLPDPAFLASSLRALKGAKWSAGAENIDEKMVRVYTLELKGAQLEALIRAGALAESSDYSSGLGMVGREYLGRVLRKAERTVTLRMYVDPKAKMPTRFKIDLFQKGRTSAGAVAIRLGAPGPAAPNRKAGDDGKPEPFLTTEITLGTAAPKTPALDDAGRKLLDGE